MKHKLSHWFIISSLILSFIILLVFLFWWIFPYKTSEQVQPYKVLSKTIKQGELLQYEIDYCKYTDKIPTVERQFVDGIIYAVPQGNAQIKEGCGKINNSIKIPHQLPPGNYYIQATVTFKMNPIRTISKVYITEKFNVIE